MAMAYFGKIQNVKVSLYSTLSHKIALLND